MTPERTQASPPIRLTSKDPAVSTPATSPTLTPPPAVESLVLADIMSRQIQQVDADSPLSEAARLMERDRISSVVVTQAGLPAGILTEHDMLRLLMAATPPTTRTG